MVVAPVWIDTVSVKNGLKIEKKPPTSIIPGDDARRWRDGAAAPRDAEIRTSGSSARGGIASPQNSQVPLLVGKFSNMQTGHSHFSPSSAMVVYGGRVRGCR